MSATQKPSLRVLHKRSVFLMLICTLRIDDFSLEKLNQQSRRDDKHACLDWYSELQETSKEQNRETQYRLLLDIWKISDRVAPKMREITPTRKIRSAQFTWHKNHTFFAKKIFFVKAISP